ncbi:hypothetical protein B0T19DRAFT_142413 [Cercophora scortea]|uniref:Uncharacterized protein n=1 Tax=Cercophora scortea TaxID=314031 RepID=A0AAE0MK25_9PEZI|nr:hypothetical protein B0T19DRAFT_142413 [Cercophora scortea]
MAAQPPSTPVKVPPSAANYTPATLDPELRSQINSLLIKEGHVVKIQEQLLHSLNAHPTNWPTAVQNHALALLRSGEISTFPALLRRVIEDVRQDTALAPASAPKASTTNGTAEVNGSAKKSANGGTPAPADGGPHGNGNTSAAAGGGSTLSLAVPQSVVEDALKVTRESLETGSRAAAMMNMKKNNKTEEEEEEEADVIQKSLDEHHHRHHQQQQRPTPQLLLRQLQHQTKPPPREVP